MAMRTTISKRWRWSWPLGAAWLALLAIPVLPQPVRAGDPARSSAPLTGLEYQETAYSLNNVGVSITKQSAVFPHEPAAVAGKVIRGNLNFGDNPSNAIPFLWQRDAGKLFLDLNRDQDFTNDPAGVFSTHLAAPLSYQTFTDVHLRFTTTSGPYPVLADLSFWDYGANSGCSASLRSFWQGKVTLAGQDWQVGVVPTVWVGKSGHRDLSIENGHLLMRPWEKRGQAFSLGNGSLDTIPFCKQLYFDGQAYQLNWLLESQKVNAPGQRPALQASLQFVAQSVPLGELKITGKYIQRLTLSGNSGNPWLVVLDHPAGVVRVPSGGYTQPNVQLEQNGVQAWCLARQVSVLVNGQAPATLDVGGPLTNSVSVARHGSDLRLDYQLLGAGGQTYQLASVNRQHPPEFAIYHGGKQIASGDFEFG